MKNQRGDGFGCTPFSVVAPSEVKKLLAAVFEQQRTFKGTVHPQNLKCHPPPPVWTGGDADIFL